MPKTKLLSIINDKAKLARLLDCLANPITEQRFKASCGPVDPNGCIFPIWDLKGRGGYTLFYVNPEFGQMGAHAIALLMGGGKLTKKKWYALHSCHHSACRAFAHLRAGSQRQNCSDIRKSGHVLTGDKNPSRQCPQKLIKKLNYSMRKRIKELYETTDLTQKLIAEKFGVNQTRISQIVRDENYGIPKPVAFKRAKAKKYTNADKFVSRHGDRHWTKRIPELQHKDKATGRFLKSA